MSKLEDFKEITDSMAKTYEAKNHDYGNSFDDSCNKFGFVASVVRMNDKIIQKLLKSMRRLKILF